MLERLLNKPKLVVLEEPKERGMRFRYECEGRSAGSILGASSTETNKTGHSKGIEDMDMNAVRLCFQCEFEWEDGRKDCLSPVVSNPIYDKKATTTSQLKIGRFNQYRGSCTGKTEIYMLCDKVQKDDIEIIFRRGSWKASAEFAQTDVHRQIAIVFKTPPYQDQDIAEEVEVRVLLRRLSDQMESESVAFTYLPHNPDPYEVNRKRKIKSDISFSEKACVTADGAPAAEPLFHTQQPQAMMAPNERLCAGQPSASGEMGYNEPQDSNNGTDATAILNQLLEMPVLWDMISDSSFSSSMPSSFEPGIDAGSAFANQDVNLNQNFGSYTQDFSHYSDLQFNMLVNEIQTPQAEGRDSPSGAVQVKTEDEL
ncbi:Transcription factor RelB [Liparis tanakae]|uniref:Transcription factor RelB n=1 Tax=Liparis tanakae TaxID=230148 RepID=A0A4Z2FU72_9TELE|nr:Transcription factor RelB [Liparis tanakae]